ncbi:MAG: transposase [Chloroflexota bacterium]
MARSLRIEYPGAFYHVTSRGNEQKAVFKSLRDREKFLTYLESATERYGAVIHVYCLMDTHYHLFIETPSGKLSKIMQHINGAYTTYFNRKRDAVVSRGSGQANYLEPLEISQKYTAI